jgi:hypothetical protein
LTPSEGGSRRKNLSRRGRVTDPSLTRQSLPSVERASGADLVASLPDSDIPELYRFWAGQRGSSEQGNVDAMRSQVIEWMHDGELLAARIAGMGRRLLMIFDVLLRSPRFELPMSEFTVHKQLSYLSTYDLQAAVAVLERHALAAPSSSRDVAHYGLSTIAIPPDLAERLQVQRRSEERSVFDIFALRGHLDRLYSNPAMKMKMSTKRQREFYKMYSNESAAVARIERLPDELRALVEKIVLEFGGILSKEMFDRMDHDLPDWNGRSWSKELEESMVGTVERLDLTRYGLVHNEETLIVFNEVALAWLRKVAVPGDPDAPRDEASLGVDLASNISRFIGYILDHQVRFTVRGEIFKSTEKRILQELIPNPGRELAREQVLAFIYGFARHSRLIENTGERTFALTSHGRDWEPRGLEEKLAELLEYAASEQGLGGEYFHQVRLRRIYLRLLKRVDVDVWYDLMYLPFLSRNTYLSNLDDLAVEDYFRAQGGHGSSAEDLQRLAWNLVGWVRKRLYLLGIVDLGYDGHGRPVAMRLTRMGAKMFGMAVGQDEEGCGIGNLVVTPDFEVVMFPTGDDSELMHDLDRFSKREKSDELVHFKILEKGVKRALSEGMFLGRILATLEQNSRTPVPQNVIYTIRDWASHAGLLQLDKKLELCGSNVSVMTRFVGDPGIRPYLSKVISDNQVQLKTKFTPKRMQVLLRDLGFLVELVD